MLFYVVSYIVTIIADINKTLSLFLKPLIICFLLLIASLNVFCIKTYHYMLSADYVEIIMGTNMQETKEFIQTYTTWTDLILFSILFLLFISLSIVSVYKRNHFHKYVGFFFLGALAISVIGISRNSGMIEEELGISTHGAHWKFKFDEIVDLRQHSTNPVFVETDSIHPNNIVIIIGESFAKKHSSLYGYEVQTNPLLEKKQKEGNLVLFQNVESPATGTTKTFKYLLTTYKVGDEKGEKKWYDNTNVIESFNILHYNTMWISCQNETGMFDNLPSGYSKLCNHAIFDERQQDEKYDDYLISAFTPQLKGNNLIIYHMYGQHPACYQRYPDSFCKFGPKNEIGKNAEKSAALADYDNATLFNDYVVSSIMDLYKNQNAIILYFSDHGMDLFDSDDSQFGHANATELSQKIGKQIPFMIYQTDGFMERYPQLSARIKASEQKPFCTDKLIYTLLDIAGYRFADGCNDVNYSLLTNE